MKGWTAVLASVGFSFPGEEGDIAGITAGKTDSEATEGMLGRGPCPG